MREMNSPPVELYMKPWCWNVTVLECNGVGM